MAEYSAKLEPVANALQAKNMDFEKGQKHIENLITTFQNHRENVEVEFERIYKNIKNTCMALDIDLKISRIVSRQTQRSNVPTSNEEEYFRHSIFAPYLDSLNTYVKIPVSR